MERWKKWKHAPCPCCNEREDIQHIAQCTHAGAASMWEQATAKLSTWFSQQEKHPSVTQLLLAHLHAWRTHQETHFPTPTIPALKTTYLDQQEIGWFNFLQGQISTYWATIQSNHYLLLNSKQSCTTCAIRLIAHLWDILWKMWLHRNHILHETPHAETEKLTCKMDHQIMNAIPTIPVPLAPARNITVPIFCPF
jgi:hypothetical protein